MKNKLDQKVPGKKKKLSCEKIIFMKKSRVKK